MKKIWQKSLASMVSAALCLTAFVGCLTVSAEKGSATITVGNGSAKPGKTVVVPVEIKANTSTDPAVEEIGGVAVALFDLQFDTKNLTVTDVSVPKNSYYCAEPKYTDAQGTTIAVDPATNTIKILASFMDTTGKDYPLDFDLMTVNVTFKVSADAKAGEYPVTIYKAQACDAGTKTGTLGNYQYADNEDFIALTKVDGKVTVTPACDHANVATNKVVKFENNVINYYNKCNDCGKLILASTDSSDVAATHAATVANFATYSAIELTTAGTATIDLAGVEQSAIKLAYISGDKIIANGAHTKTVAYNPIKLTSYADGVVTINSTVTGVIIAYTLTDSVAVDAVLRTAAMQRSFELLSNISYKFKLKQTSVQYSSADVFDSLYVVVNHDVYNNGTISTVKSEPIFANAELESGYYIFPYAVKAMQMGDTVVCNYYGVKDGVSYLLRVMDDYNVVTNAVKYTFTDTTGLADKKMISDLLRYGAEAQKYFSYNTSALVTDNESVKAGLVEGSSVALSDLQKLTSAVTNKVTIDGEELNVVGWQRSVSLDDAININFKLAPANFEKYYGVSADQLQLKMNYIDKFGDPQTVELAFSDYDYIESPRYVYVCDQIAASKMGSEASMEVWYNGDKISTFYYSVESFLAENYTSLSVSGSTTLGDLCKAIANYSASVVAVFG